MYRPTLRIDSVYLFTFCTTAPKIMPAQISLRCIVTSYSSQHNELVDLIGATTMGTGETSPPPQLFGWGTSNVLVPPTFGHHFQYNA